MILGFTQKINKKPNYFVRKILFGLIKGGVCKFSDFDHYNNLHREKFGVDFENKIEYKEGKIHTIRAGNRWRVGMVIDFFINTRTINMFRFAPKIAAKHVQKIKINWVQDYGNDLKIVCIEIDNQPFIELYTDLAIGSDKLIKLAINDGFESASDFLNYFNKDFTGQLIFWAGDKY